MHRIADRIFRAKPYQLEPSEIHRLPPEAVIKVQAKAMKDAGVPADKVNAVIAASKKHAPKLVRSV